MRQVPHKLSLMGLFFLCFSCLASAPASSILEFNFPEIEIGSVVNPKGPTGLTLFYFPKGAQAAIDIRGGSVGTFFTQEKMHHGDAWIDGIALCGGGILGLEAVSGVISTIFKEKQQNKFNQMPLISGGVIFDYTPRKNFIYPDHQLGQQAYQQRKVNQFHLGAHGVGVSATAGKLFGEHHAAGQGGAFAQYGQTKIAVFTVVNAVGVILNERGEVIHGSKQPIDMAGFLEKNGAKLAQNKPFWMGDTQNTTLTVVVTNEKLAPKHLQQLAKSVHHALSQTIFPYATNLDGDLVYAVSTQSVVSDLYQPGAEIEKDLNLRLIYLATAAGDLAKQAVWSSIGYAPKSA